MRKGFYEIAMREDADQPMNLCRPISVTMETHLSKCFLLAMKVKGTLPGGATILLLILPPNSVGVNSKSKEFAPVGANPFLSRVDPILEELHCTGKQIQSKKKVLSLRKMTEKRGCTHSHLGFSQQIYMTVSCMEL